MKSLITIIILGVASAFGYSTWKHYHATDQGPQFRLAKIDRGDLKATIASTGKVDPAVVTHDIGAQVNGTLLQIFVDYNSPVTKGQQLALIDPALYQAKLNEDQAALKKSEADLGRATANREKMRGNWRRAEDLRQKGKQYLSDADYDQAKADLGTADADVAVCEATVNQGQQTVQTSKINVGYCNIVSPVNGVVTERKVNVGQTVASAFTTPSLFLIAEDLSQIQIVVSVDEADIGKIFVGQKVTFTVDAYDQEEFQGEVLMVRLDPTTVQNVVTYAVVVKTDNPPEPPRYPFGKLLPGLTTNMTFVVDQKADVLRIPNAALRFRPDPALIAHSDTDTDETPHKHSAGGVSGGNGTGKPQGKVDASVKTVWLPDGNHVRSVRLKVGISDSATTEILSDELKDGDEVVVGIQSKTSDTAESNPFAPSIFKKK